MKTPTPLYAQISANGALFTVVFPPHGDMAAHSIEHCSDRVFAPYHGSGVPLVDMREMDFTGYSSRPIFEAHAHFNQGYPRLADWLAEVQQRGVTLRHL